MTQPASGIYKITNTINGKVYIGQSQNVWQRRNQHFIALRRNRHENKQMQADWNKNNGRGFRFDVVEYCGLKLLNEKEKYWIEHYNATNAASGYNQGWVPYKRTKTDALSARKVKKYHKTR